MRRPAAVHCQRGGDPRSCTRPGTHALMVDGADSGVRMCGPHARDAVITWMAQGEQNIAAVQVDGGAPR